MHKSNSTTTKNKHKDYYWTLLGLIALNGDYIMCVLILAGIRKTIYEYGMDVFSEQVGGVIDHNYFKQNCDKGKWWRTRQRLSENRRSLVGLMDPKGIHNISNPCQYP